MYEPLLQINDFENDLPVNGTSSSNPQIPSQFLRESVFAGGSFWALEASFGNINGVLKSSTGYFGGTLTKPSYKEVCEGGTGHTEAIKLVYDIRTISFTSLCDHFWDTHDPTNKDFLNFGLSTHQRSVIFYSTEEEKKEAQKSKIRKQMKLNKRINTKIIPLGDCEFYLAENPHQKYHLQKHYRLCASLGLRSTQQFVESTLACKLNGILGMGEEHIIDELANFLEIQELSIQAKLDCEEIIEDLKARKKNLSSNK